MKLLFDLQALQPDRASSQFHGGGEYARILLQKALERGYGHASIIDCLYDRARPVDENVLKMCAENNLTLFDIGNIPDLSGFINKGDYDIFYSALPYEGYGGLDLEKTVFIYTLHGLRVLEMPCDRYEYKYGKGLKSLAVFAFKILFTSLYKS
jgi:hypothetical protein